MTAIHGDWFAVRCVFGASGRYEERITLWRAQDIDAAIERAETDAHEYAATLATPYLGLAQAFQLFDAPGDGVEVFSLIRDSPLAPKSYIDAFFDTGTEYQRTH